MNGLIIIFLSKWASEYCLMPNEQFLSYIMVRTSYIQWDDICFLLDQHVYLDFYGARSLKQQSVSSHVIALRYIILIPLFNQSFFLHLNAACLAEKQQVSIL
jgi:hypothetical protein